MNFKLLAERLDALTLPSGFEQKIYSDLDNLNLLEQEKLDFLAFYGLNYTRLFPVEHDFGYIDVGQFRIAAYYWALEPKKAKGTLLLMHGLFDHIGLLKYMIEYGLSRGYNVLSFDLPGHGLSTGARAAIGDWQEYVDVLENVMATFQKKFDKPWRVIAQSTGAAILMDYLISQQYTEDNCPFEKIVLLAPLVRPKNWSYSNFLINTFGWLVGDPVRAFTVNSNDPEFIRFIREDDPLQPQLLSLLWLRALQKWMKRFKALPNSRLSPAIVQGKLDGTVNGPYNVNLLSQKFRQPTVYWIPEARHQLINESLPVRDKIMGFIDQYFEVDDTQRVEPMLISPHDKIVSNSYNRYSLTG